MTVGQCFVAAGINDSGSSGGYSGGTAGLIGYVTGNKKLEFQDWPGNTGIMAGNVIL